MLIAQVCSPKRAPVVSTQSLEVRLGAGVKVPVHVARYRRDEIHPRVVVFKKPMALLAWCQKNNVSDAINGGFSLYHKDGLLGEVRVASKKHDFVSFSDPWHLIRGSAHISPSGRLRLSPRHHLPKEPTGDLLQAGPLLVRRGKSLIIPGQDPEGISSSSHQFDSDWTTGYWPRAAIGVNSTYIWSVATDGYKAREPDGQFGLSLGELAQLMMNLGATEALNLDGGSSATLVSGSQLINKPRAGVKNNYRAYPQGRALPSAIIFEPRSG